MNIVYILWLRQLKRYVRSRARIVGSLGQPLLFLVAFGFGFGPVFQKAGGGDYIQFLAPGIVAMSVMFTGLFSGIEILWDRQFGFLKETLVAPVSRFQIVLGRTLGGATVASIQGLIVFALAAVVGFRPAQAGLFPVALLFMFLIALGATGVGTAVGSVLQDMQGFQLIINFLVMPAFFLSGALYPLKGLPAGVAMAAQIDPLSYGIDGLRATLTGAVHFGLALDFAVLGAITAVLLAVGSYLFSKIQV